MMSRFMIVMSLDIIFLTLTYSAFNWKEKQIMEVLAEKKPIEEQVIRKGETENGSY